MPTIALSSVSFRYPKASSPALEGVSLRVGHGEMVGLLGPNGCGKSTLLKLVAQVEHPASGSVVVEGAESADAVRALLGVVFQTPSLDPRMTVEENLGAYAVLNGLGEAGEARVAELLQTMGLAERTSSRLETLSLGLARRVDLCRALLHRPAILLLDEPTTGLDPPSREQFLETIDRVRREDGTTVLMSTHTVEEAERCARVVLMHRGRIVEEGAPAALRAGLGARVLTVVSGSEPPMVAGIDTSTWTRRAQGWTAPLPEGRSMDDVVAELLRAGVAFGIAPPTLGDLFARITGQELQTTTAERSPPTRSRRRSREASRAA